MEFGRMFAMRIACSGSVHCISWAFGIGLLAAVSVLAPAAQAQTLDRIRDAGKIRLGYEKDARPFSFENDTGKPDGYAVSLCAAVADELKKQLGLSDLAVEWVALGRDERFEAVTSGTADLICSANSVTLDRRQTVSFSIPIFPGGIGALVRADVPIPLREFLERGRPADRPIWRGSPAWVVLEKKTYTAVADTTGEAWLNELKLTFKVDATVTTVATYDEGIKAVLDGSTDVFFGDRPILLDAASRSRDAGNLIVLDRNFTYEPLALALPRGDEDFRLAVDRALSHFYKSDGLRDVYTEWFGRPDEVSVTFFRQSTLPD
jgi:polar amino acid transport system substrate-binding protein